MSTVLDSEIYGSILENLPTGLCVVDLQQKIVLWSAGAERITGHLRYEVIGRSCVGEDLLHCEQPECEFCTGDSPLVRAIKTAQPQEAIGFLHHKAGHEIPVRARAIPVRNGHGSIVGAAEIFEDHEQPAIPDHRESSLKLAGCVDEVTSVASHVMMQAHLRETLGTFSDMNVPFAILLFRLEGLEVFRSRFGSAAASSLLRVVAHTLEGALWKTDFVGRWSDNQFLVVLNACNHDALLSVRERVRRMLAADGIDWWGERRSLPISIGEATAQAGDSIASLVARAQDSFDVITAWRTYAAAATRANSSSHAAGS